jgi:hypothetical protein
LDRDAASGETRSAILFNQQLQVPGKITLSINQRLALGY